ncbi:cellulose biosynthesis cyclic di-GMP-binding regulatory protein BcsB [Labrys monachus]|uniref:Cyclic di-GMP-binding protein n=1 Tax=Labrys monachus TaxID=217067 RepID=A0ABU0F8B0_9HYPH|nr:cellulose biosynthesis cyclic di-GMP-binding regulatory protein BcsB [Labrys monachus]MDQ0390676.1 hypothetical protein [Labrys monachus]
MRRRTFALLFSVFLAGSAPGLQADEAQPFDMTPERGNRPAPLPSPIPLPLPPAAVAPAPAPDQTAAPAPAPVPPAAAATPAAAPQSPATLPNSKAKSQPTSLDRPILPYKHLILEGEIDSKTWNVVLTRDQAASPVTLTLGYKAAVFVAPESSRLSLRINNRPIFDTPIEASDRLGQLTAQLPAGLLRPGPNLFRLEATQRHRTDCTIASTYELRTEIDSASTALHFQSPTAPRLARVEDLAAVSPDVDGETRLRIVTPKLGQKVGIAPVLRFAQAASILIGMPNQDISVMDGPNGPPRPGVMTAAIGTAEDLKTVMRTVPPEAASQPIVTFVDDPALGPSTLVISGPSPTAVSHAVDAVAALVARPRGVPRAVLDTSRWAAPNPPLLLGAGHARLSNLGVVTQEFSGRRFKAEFQIGIPSDFYAGASGEALLMLDAAYSNAVLPGSHLDIYVNDDIAATTPLSANGGEILRHLPIRIPMAHFRPGPNRITFEAQLHTAADMECAAGPTKGDARFVLFDTSEFVLPDFARIARLPNLAALQGTGFPYNISETPVAVVLGEFSPDAVSAAATLLGRMAVSAGRVIDVDLDASPSTLRDRNAIFVATASQIPSGVADQLDLDGRIGSLWKAPEDSLDPGATPLAANAMTGIAGNALAVTKAPDALSDPADTQETFDRWRERLSTSGSWRGDVSSFQDWLQQTFQVSTASLRFLPSRDAAFEPSRNNTALIAQGPSVSGDKAWTLLTAPSPRLLREGADDLTDGSQWLRLSGRLVSYSAKTNATQTLPVATFSFIPTAPFSLANLRLIAANWLSENIFAFSLLLFAACLLLGLATALFLSHIGRRSSL